ncbi:uncharacterized protein LOC144902785 isoform X4 [Branchiostoma floridae x Branchiostoma belcheri]
MMGKPAGVLMFLLVILKVLGTAEADCSCTASYCSFCADNREALVVTDTDSCQSSLLHNLGLTA